MDCRAYSTLYSVHQRCTQPAVVAIHLSKDVIILIITIKLAELLIQLRVYSPFTRNSFTITITLGVSLLRPVLILSQTRLPARQVEIEGVLTAWPLWHVSYTAAKVDSTVTLGTETGWRLSHQKPVFWPLFALFWDQPIFGHGSHFFTRPLPSLEAELSASW
jgi:hypothetical protein